MANAHINTALNGFFGASKFAVVGASKDPSKFGNKVLKWYQAHNLDVTPIHPKEPEIESVATQPDVAHFLDNAGTSAENVAISVVTPPMISLAVVQKGLQDQGVSTFWLQVSSTASVFDCSTWSSTLIQPLTYSRSRAARR